MRFYRVVLKGAGATCMEADTWCQGEHEVQFFRDGALFARYPAGLVEQVSEMEHPPSMTSFFTAEGSED
ncbi:MAG: hypothetical protein ACAH88_19240 [Roseimicrobium sp.]